MTSEAARPDVEPETVTGEPESTQPAEPEPEPEPEAAEPAVLPDAAEPVDAAEPAGPGTGSADGDAPAGPAEPASSDGPATDPADDAGDPDGDTDGDTGDPPDGRAPAAAPRRASMLEPVPVTDTGYLIDRPDVAQAVCVDRDARRINLTALRPVAIAHPYPLVFSSVSGSHLYGFPSADSDVDLHGAHLLPAVQVVGLRHGPQTFQRSWLHDEVRVDVETFDVGKFFRLMLRRNGTVLEQLLSPLVVTSGPVHEELVALAGGCLTRQHAHHYRAAGQTQWELYQQSGQLKPLLYTFRELLTGIHLIRTGELVAHLPTLLELVPGAPGYLAELIELKAAGDYEGVPVLPERVGDDIVTLQAELDLAEDGSPLPDHPGSEGALHDLLVRLRLEGTAARPA